MRILFAVMLLVSPLAQANDYEFENLFLINSDWLMQREIPSLKNIRWKVGDYQKRRIKRGALRVGKLHSWVDREEKGGKHFWLNNNLDIVLKKRQFIEILIKRRTGEILRYIVDGEEKDPPDVTQLNDCAAIDKKQESVRVPSGTFKATRSIIRCPDETVAIWVAKDRKVNMNGHVKQALLDQKKEDPDKPEYIVELTEFGRK